MQLTGWRALKRRIAGGGSGRLWSRAALALLPITLLAACESAPSFERSADGSVVYLNQLSPARKAVIRAKIVRTLSRGDIIYELHHGDEIEVFFHVNPEPTLSSYLIRPGDKLRIDFLNEAQPSSEFLVRPDGRISMPLIGPVEASGKTASALTKELEHRYTKLVTNPQITVNLTLTHSPLDEFIGMIGSVDRPRSIADKVLPDGTISVPLLRPIVARGRTLEELTREIDAGYRTLRLGVTVSLVVRALQPGTAMVLGEVHTPGLIVLNRPHTVLMTIAQAGGVLTSGSLENIRIFYIGKDGVPRVRRINLEDEIDGLRLEDDMIVPSNSVIYVPPTELAKTGRLLDQVLRDILRYQGFSLGGTFLLNNQNNGTVVIPSP